MDAADLRAWRARYKLTQTDLAQMLDVRQNTVWRWETGASPVPRTTELSIEALTVRLTTYKDEDADSGAAGGPELVNA